jgi:hypothetical protein
MSRGRQTRALRKDQIERLEKFRRSHHDGAHYGYSFPQLRLAMGMRFGWATLKKALSGLPVWDLHYTHIAEWIERYLPAAPAKLDGKQLASGETPEQQEPAEIDPKSAEPNELNAKETGTAKTLRGSR